MCWSTPTAPTRHCTRLPDGDRAGCRAGALGFVVSSVAEFWAVVTHRSNEGRPSVPAEAGAYLAALAEAGAEVWEPGAGFGARLAQLAVDLDVSGPRVFDLQIALTAFEGGATELWTADARFVKLPGLRLHNPLSVR
jgi:predicted nucleic acid-binding protein